MAHKTEFLYMSEPDTIAAGVLDARKCIDNAEEVFTLLAKGDYLMGCLLYTSPSPRDA